MASASSRFIHDETKWYEHQAKNRFSENPRFGLAAVIFSTVGNVRHESGDDIGRQIEYFEREASEIVRNRRAMGGRALLIEGMTMQNMSYIFDNPGISDVCIIGDGTFNSIYNDDGNSDSGVKNRISWHAAAQMASHLKLGTIQKRTCGGITNGILAVPFGAFTVSDHRNLYGVIDQAFEPEDFPYTPLLESKEEDKIQQLCTERILTRTYVDDNFYSTDEPDQEPTLEHQSPLSGLRFGMQYTRRLARFSLGVQQQASCEDTN